MTNTDPYADTPYRYLVNATEAIDLAQYYNARGNDDDIAVDPIDIAIASLQAARDKITGAAPKQNDKPKVRNLGRAWGNGYPNDALKVGAIVRSTWNTSGALWTVESIDNNKMKTVLNGELGIPYLHIKSVKSGRADSRWASDLDVVEVIEQDD